MIPCTIPLMYSEYLLSRSLCSCIPFIRMRSLILSSVKLESCDVSSSVNFFTTLSIVESTSAQTSSVVPVGRCLAQ